METPPENIATSLDSLRLGRSDRSVAASVVPFARRRLRCRSCVTCHEHGTSHVIAPALGRLLSPAPRRGCQSTLVGRCRLRGHLTRFDSGASIGLSRRLLFPSRAADCGIAPALRAMTRRLARHRAGPRPSLVTRASSRLSINPRRSLSLARSLDTLRLGRFDWSVAASVGLFARRQLRCRSFVTCHEHGTSRVIAPALGRLL